MSEFPKLLWSPGGVEVTVTAPDEEAALVEQGYRYTKEAKPKKAAKVADAEGFGHPAEPQGEPPAELPAPAPDDVPDDESVGGKKAGAKKKK
jgi:hypothetical protein